MTLWSRAGALRARGAGPRAREAEGDDLAQAGTDRIAAALIKEPATTPAAAQEPGGGPHSLLVYSPATAVGTAGSDFMISIFAVSNLSGGSGNDLLIGDYPAFEAIRSNESNNTRATAKNLETNLQMWTTSGTDIYVGPASQPYGSVYIEGQAGATRWVSFSAAAGASISFDVDFAFGSGFGTDSDLVVDLVDASGNVLLTVDDVADLDPGSWSTNDPRFVGFVAGYTGTYYLNFREFDGNFEGDEVFLAYIAVSGHAAPGTLPIGADILSGDDGNDEIYGGEGNDSISGGTGIDYLFGGYGDDGISGGDGNDHIQGHFGSDTIDGGIGNDTVGAGGDNDTVYGGDGDDYVEGQSGLDTLDGQAGNDRLFGGDDNDTAIGGAGYDRMFGGNGDDLLQGGNDWDLLTGETGADTMQGGAGRDVLFGQVQGNVQGAYVSGNDSFDGGTENDLIFAGRESDTILGGTGDDLIYGDTTYVSYSARSTSLNGGALSFPLNDASIWSLDYSRIVTSSTTVAHTTAYVETFAGEFRVFSIDLVAGQTITIDIDSSLQGASLFTVDTALGLFSNATNAYVATNDDNSALDPGSVSTSESFLTYVVQSSGTYRIVVSEFGGDGSFEGDEAFLMHVSVAGHAVGAIVSGAADNISGNDGNDDISGGFGDDTISGDNGNDFIAAGAGADLIDGGAGNDNVLGDSGNDIITDPSGTNTLSGGDGNDTITGGINGDTIDGGIGNDSLAGGDGNDTIVGGVGDDTISGGNGSDVLSDTLNVNTVHGNAGFDMLTSNGLGAWYGDEDNDTIIVGGAGSQLLDGGTGVDKLDLTGLGGAAATVDLGLGTASFAGGGVAGFENITGGGGNENLTGNGEANQFLGAGGADTLNGAGGNDRLEGGDGNDTADGGAGDDVIFGGNNDDTLSGGADNDVVHGDGGFDIVSGGDGNDYLSDRAGGGTLNGGAGDDTLVLGDGIYSQDDGIQTATGGSGADLFQLFSASNIQKLDRITDFSVAEGDRISFWSVTNGRTFAGYWPVESYFVFAGAWGGSLQPGAAYPAAATAGVVQLFVRQINGNTQLVVDSDGDFVVDAQDMVVQLDGLLTLTAASFADRTFALPGTTGDDVLNGTVAGDSIYGLAGNDTINGLDGADWIDGGEGHDVIDAGAGRDEVNGGSGNDTLRGGADDDNLFGGEGDDSLFGESGNDTLTGYLGADRLDGGAGDDTYYVYNAGVRVAEASGGGDDIVRTEVSFTLAAGAEIETLRSNSQGVNTALELIGNEFANRIFGNVGANFLDGGAGADLLTGDAGNDIYIVDNAGDAVAEAVGQGRDVVYAFVNYTLTAGQEIEVLSTISQAATTPLELTGNQFRQEMYGNDGANFIDGGVGDEDYMRGFGGNDTYIVDHGSDYVAEFAGGGRDVVYAKVSYTLTPDSEVEVLSVISQSGGVPIDLTGNALVQEMYGNTDANFLDGGGGADYMQGFAGNDSYVVEVQGDVVVEAAGEGRDVVYARASYVLAAGQSIEVLSAQSQGSTAALDLTGNELANELYGSAGANVLNGGLGADYLQGFGGADSFAFTTALGGGNVDQLADFLAGTDKVALDDAIFAGIGAPGAFNANAFVTGSQAGDADDRIIYNAATGQLFYDADGNGAGAAVLFASLSGNPALAASDFMVI